MEATYADEAVDDDETALLESQREMDEALNHICDLQIVIDEYGGFTSDEIKNISINKLLFIAPSIDLINQLYNIRIRYIINVFI